MSKKMSKIIGITGGIGTGKTIATKIFCDSKSVIIDADYVYNNLISPKSPLWNKIINAFGEKILNKDLKINKKKLSEIVFNNKSDKKLLEKITHPYIIKEIKRLIKLHRRRSDAEFIVVDAPLLYESGLDRIMDKVIVVWAPRKLQIQRLKKRDNLDKDQILKRIKSQLSIGKKIKTADYVVKNQKNINVLRGQIKKIKENLTKKN